MGAWARGSWSLSPDLWSLSQDLWWLVEDLKQVVESLSLFLVLLWLTQRQKSGTQTWLSLGKRHQGQASRGERDRLGSGKKKKERKIDLVLGKMRERDVREKNDKWINKKGKKEIYDN